MPGTPQFPTNRAVREYTEWYYFLAAKAYRARAAQEGELGSGIANWHRAPDKNWETLRFGQVDVETVGGQYCFSIEVYCGELDPDAVRVELYAEAPRDDGPVCEPMRRTQASTEVDGYSVFSASVQAVRALPDFTVRVRPHHVGVWVPLEAPHILCQR